MKLKKNVISMFVVVSLCSTMGFAYTDETTNLTEYINESKLSNLDIKLLNEKLPRQITEYNKIIQLSKAVNQDMLDETDDDYNLKVMQELNPLIEKKVLFDLKYSIMKTENAVVKSSTKYFYDYQIALKNFENSKDGFNTSLDKYDIKKMEKELGLISEIDYLKFEQEYYNAYITYLKATNDFENLKKNINLYVSKSPSEEIDFELIDINRIDTSYTVNVKEIIELAINNSYQIKALELQNEIESTSLKLKTRFAGFYSIVEEIADHEDAILQNNININNLKLDIDYNVNKLSNELFIEKNKYAIAEMEYNLSEKEFRASTIKFESGLISEFDYTKLKQLRVSSKINFENSRISMAMKILEVKAYIDENVTIIK